MHDQSITAFNPQFVELRGLREFELSTLFDRRLRSLVNQFGQNDVVSVFGAQHLHVTTDKLSLLVTTQLQIGVDSRTKVLRIIERDFLALNIEQKLRNGKARELSAARCGYLSAAQGARQLFNLRLARIKEDCAGEICQLDALVAEQYGNRRIVNRSTACHALVFVSATDIDCQHRNAGRENIGRETTENS